MKDIKITFTNERGETKTLEMDKLSREEHAELYELMATLDVQLDKEVDRSPSNE